ncbi:MAG: hypothetical protein KDE51_09070 [Anaerolineales bacterium]|nr:hypothetical protein [Anaerolineales bacterium]
MMGTHNTYTNTNPTTIGDTAVDGLLAGIGGGLLMMLFLIIATSFLSETPLTLLAKFDPSNGNSWLQGLLSHLAVSTIYGLLYAVGLVMLSFVWPAVKRLGWAIGLLFGLCLGLIGRGWLLPLTDSALLEIPAVLFMTAHLLYGLVLGILIMRRLKHSPYES